MVIGKIQGQTENSSLGGYILDDPREFCLRVKVWENTEKKGEQID